MTSEEDALRARVDKAVSADPDAWEWLYRRIHPRLFAYARRRLPGDAAADDAVSETMARAIDKISDFDWRGAGFDGWLFGILRNVVLETYRSDGRAQLYETVPMPGDHVLDPAAIVEGHDERKALRAAFEQLSEADRELLELRVLGELSADEVGMALGKRAGAVRMAQSRAVDRLRSRLRGIDRV